MLAKEAAWARRRRFGTRDDADGSLPRFARSETKPILATRWISEVSPHKTALMPETILTDFYRLLGETFVSISVRNCMPRRAD